MEEKILVFGAGSSNIAVIGTMAERDHCSLKAHADYLWWAFNNTTLLEGCIVIFLGSIYRASDKDMSLLVLHVMEYIDAEEERVL